ncbi:hypothetical protein BZM27_46820 [Paraburkholderia steynii]|uniref:Uncharacterized protein n=1 Tax=Paraburkholderia steynii TaxID=1245441 RepID=A0A4R0X4I0_9BURK|nr:hypothetical protein BZM27_46820 [Paraburkholderia steynii]
MRQVSACAASVRATRNSGGDFSFFSDRDAKDGAKLVQWVVTKLPVQHAVFSARDMPTVLAGHQALFMTDLMVFDATAWLRYGTSLGAGLHRHRLGHCKTGTCCIHAALRSIIVLPTRTAGFDRKGVSSETEYFVFTGLLDIAREEPVFQITRLVTHKNTGNLPSPYSAFTTDR